MKAIVLIKIQTGEIQSAIRDLRRLPSVTEAQMTFGPYDGLVIVDAADLKALGQIISWDIQTIPGVRETCTCIMVESETADPPERLVAQDLLDQLN